MTKEKEKRYHETNELRAILEQALKGRKFKLDCGHHITWNHFLGNNITIYNGSVLRIICSECGY